MILRDLSTEKAAQAVVQRNEGVTQTAIALRLGVHQSTIQLCLERHQESGTFNTRRSNCGRHRVTTARTDTLIRRIAVANPTASSSYIATQLPADVRVANRTIRHRLQHDFDLKAYRPAPKPRFSAKNIKDRLAPCHRLSSIGQQQNGGKYSFLTRLPSGSTQTTQRMSGGHQVSAIVLSTPCPK